MSVLAGAEGDWDVVAAPVVEHLGDVGGVAGHHHGLREEPVGAGVGGVTDEVAGADEDAVGAEQTLEIAAQRLGRTPGQRVGGAVGRSHQKRDMPGATGTSTSSGCEEAKARSSAPRTSSRLRARWALTP